MGLIGTIRLKLLGGFSASLALGGRWSLWAEEPGAPGLSHPRPGASGMAARSRWRGYGPTAARLKTGVACPRPPQLDGKQRGARGQRATPHRIVRTVANSLTATPYPFPMNRWPIQIELPGARTLASVVSIRPAIAAACGAPWLRRALPACSRPGD